MRHFNVILDLLYRRDTMKTTPPATFRELYRRAIPALWTSRAMVKISSAHLMDAEKIIGNPRLDEISTDMIDHYKNKISFGVSPATVNRKLSSMHKLLKYAHDRDWLAKMPMFSWNKEDNERVRWLSKEEELQLLSMLPKDVSVFCELLLQTGMRRSELLNLTPDNVDGSYIRLWKTKTGKPRSVPMSQRAQVLIKDFLSNKPDVTRIHKEWLKAKKAMGLENDKNFVLHILRHTTATRMLDTTGNIAVVQRMLGHSKITTTMRYAHIADDKLLEAVQATSEKHNCLA